MRPFIWSVSDDVRNSLLPLRVLSFLSQSTYISQTKIWKSIFEVNSNKSTDHYFSSIRAGRTKLKVRGQTVSKEVPTWLFVSKSSGFFNVYYAFMIWFLSSQVLYLFKFYPLGKIGSRGGWGVRVHGLCRLKRLNMFYRKWIVCHCGAWSLQFYTNSFKKATWRYIKWY